jgi:uncharacterized protein (DUF1778 family)
VRVTDQTTQKRTEAINLRLTPEEKRWLSDIAALEERSVSQVLRLALRDYYRAKVGS